MLLILLQYFKKKVNIYNFFISFEPNLTVLSVVSLELLFSLPHWLWQFWKLSSFLLYLHTQSWTWHSFRSYRLCTLLFPLQTVGEGFGKSNRDKAGKVGHRQNRPEKIDHWVELLCSQLNKLLLKITESLSQTGYQHVTQDIKNEGK